MKTFLLRTLASFTGTLMALGLSGLLAFILFIVLIVSLSRQVEKEFDPGKVEKGSVLHLKLSSGLLEHQPDDPFERFDPGSFQVLETLALDSLLFALEEARDDAKVKGIFLDLKGPTGPLARVMEMRHALERFRSSGKFIHAFADDFDLRRYLLASACDVVHLAPQGDITMDGIQGEMLFFGRMLKEWDVDVEIFRGRDNDYKSAVEPFFRENMSEESREQTLALMRVLWDEICTSIETSRGLNSGDVDAFVRRLMPSDGIAARELGLVDELLYRDQSLQALAARVGEKESDDITWMSALEYARAMGVHPVPGLDDLDEPGIAVLLLEGAIVDDSANQDDAFKPSDVRHWMKQVRDDPQVKALVLRIDSPGGSALAAENMWREVDRMTEEIPVVVSMGPAAASGGYYIAASSNLILVNTTTLTGSIGVFGLMPRADKLLERHLHITVDRIGTHPELGSRGFLGPLGDMRRQDITQQVDRIYDLFIRRVADGRSLTPVQVHQLARGRVWSGTDAVEKGLADRLGGLWDAMDQARRLADLPGDAPAVFVRTELDFAQWLEQIEIGSKVQQMFIPEPLRWINTDRFDFYSYDSRVFDLSR